MGNINNYNHRHVVFNFIDATDLTFRNVQWRGSVLAPRAVIDSPTGAIDGQIFARRWIGGSNCMQQNWEPFEGCIPDYCRNVDPIPYCTSTQEGWTVQCSTDNAATLPCVGEEKFFECFSYDGISVGCLDSRQNGHSLTLSTYAAVRAFLPQEEIASQLPLNQDYLDPVAGTSAGAAVGELVSLSLSLQMDQCNSDSKGLCSTFGELFLCSVGGRCGAFQGQTIGSFVGIANRVIGGCDTSYSVDQVYDCMVTLNTVFEGCTLVTDVDLAVGYCACDQEECPALPSSLRLSDVSPAAPSFVPSWMSVFVAALVAYLAF